MAHNKVVYGNTTLIDLTGDTATAADVAQGKTFHLASGASATGTAQGGTITDNVTTLPSGGDFHDISGTVVEIEALSVTENGTYSETGKAYSPVTVNVSGGGANFLEVTISNQCGAQVSAWYPTVDNNGNVVYNGGKVNIANGSSASVPTLGQNNSSQYTNSVIMIGCSTVSTASNLVATGAASSTAKIGAIQTTAYIRCYEQVNGTITLSVPS